MTQRFIRIGLFMVLVPLTTGIGQGPEDWRKHFGLPESERYLVRDQILVTVFYSPQGRTCEIKINPHKAESRTVIDDLMNEIIPLNERGKKIRSIGLGGIGGGIESTLYDRVNISAATTAQGPAANIESATISWIGIECKYGHQEKRK